MILTFSFLFSLCYFLQYNCTALMLACENGRTEAARILVERGADLEVRSKVRAIVMTF